MGNVETVRIDSISPAPYNPRRISDGQIEELQRSIRDVGFVVPIIINRKNNIIIAGHQRTKSAQKLGFETVPALYVEDIVKGDEIKFNQMHNGVEEKTFGAIVLRGDYEKETFLQISADNFEMKSKTFPMQCVKEICKILMKYGNAMSAVVCRGAVVFASEYVYACKMLSLPVNCYICEDSKLDAIMHYFVQNYGEYTYDGIEKKTYVQGLAQMHRTVGDTGGKKGNKSKLYETMVFPFLQRNAARSILDFGCGKGAYIEHLKKRYAALGLEFYNNNGKAINISKGNAMIDELIKAVKKDPQFDIVVCDSVLNSVDSKEAEESVMACLNLFCRSKLFISGRTARSTNRRNLRKATDTQNYIYFTDDDGLSGTYREGQWYFQKFHSEEQAHALANRYGFVVEKYTENSTSFQMECRKVRELPREQYIKGICFEFNLPLPNGKRYNRHKEMLQALGLGDEL